MSALDKAYFDSIFCCPPLLVNYRPATLQRTYRCSNTTGSTADDKVVTAWSADSRHSRATDELVADTHYSGRFLASLGAIGGILAIELLAKGRRVSGRKVGWNARLAGRVKLELSEFRMANDSLYVAS